MAKGSTHDKTETIRHRLYEVMDDSALPLAEQQRRALTLGCDYLGVESGHIQCPIEDGDTHEVIASVGADSELLPVGKTLDHETTYCRRTLSANSSIALSNAGEQGWADDPAYQEHKFECYLGTTIFVSGEPYGTVCFISRGSREDDFTPEEKTFVELIARLLGREIQANEKQEVIAKKERARQRSAGALEALVELAPDAIFVADADTGSLVRVNQKATDLTGYAESELHGMSVLDLHPPEDRDQYEELVMDALDGTIRERFDDGTPLYIRCADGSDIPVEMNVSTVKRDDCTLIQGIIRDISGRRERERELERNREFLRQTQRTAALGGWKFDIKSETLELSDEVYRIHGLSPEDSITVDEALEFYLPDDRPTIEAAFERLLADEEPYDVEIRLITADDEVRWVRTTGVPQYDDHGSLIAVHGVFQDITDRKDREAELRVKDRAIEEASVGITIADATADGLPLTYVNSRFEEMTGYDRTEVRGKNCRFLQGPETDEDALDAIRDAIAAERPVRTQLLNYTADGTPFWNDLTISPVSGTEADAVTHFVGFQRDATARERRERAIDILDRVLRHNLRNKISIIKGNADLLIERNDGETSELAGYIRSAAAEVNALAEKARRIETVVRDGRPVAERDLVDDVETVVRTLQSSFPETKFTIESPASLRVMGTDHLQDALYELGENAAIHTSSSVEFSVERTGDSEVTVSVTDSGPGLPECEQRVLETGDESPLAHGSGVGLWLVNWIVTGVGGDVTATVDDGTQVTVHLQQSTAADAPAHGSIQPTTIRGVTDE